MVDIHIPEGSSYTDELKKRLKEYGISYTDLAEQMGLHLSQVSRWMNNPKMQPRVDSMVAIERAVTAIRQRREQEARQAGDPAP